MNRSIWFAIASLALASSLVALDEAQLEKKMKAAGEHMGALRKAMQANSMPDVATHAKGLVAAMDGTDSFWAERKMADAVTFNKDGLAAAKELAAAAEAGHADHAKSAMAKVGGSCKGCHDAHREKLPDGKYRIK